MDDMKPGSVREVSSSIGSWLIAERFAEPEMRRDRRMHEEDFLMQRENARERLKKGPRRRWNER
ncbi:MAG: hypothetical protein ACRD2I_27270 [Vicinamibacterales bacterium]